MKKTRAVTAFLMVLDILSYILISWGIFSFFEVIAKNLHSEPISVLNLFSLITLISP